jgi:hypothetical protein
MRPTVRTIALILALAVLVVPLTAYAAALSPEEVGLSKAEASSDTFQSPVPPPAGACPDDPVASQNCDPTAPPFYVVINRSVEILDERPGTGCQPWLLNHPFSDCAAQADTIDIEAEVCGPMLYKRVTNSDGSDPILYEMCCDCSTSTDGTWVFRVRIWADDGTCPLDPDNAQWIEGLPPGTGIDLPAPVIVGGLALLGAALLGTGMVLRRRSLSTA